MIKTITPKRGQHSSETHTVRKHNYTKLGQTVSIAAVMLLFAATISIYLWAMAYYISPLLEISNPTMQKVAAILLSGVGLAIMILIVRFRGGKR